MPPTRSPSLVDSAKPYGILGKLLDVSYDLVERSLFQLNLRELVSIGNSHPSLDILIKTHVQRTIGRMFSGLGLDAKHTLEVLDQTGSVVSGSCALLVLNPFTFHPKDLDVYCSRGELDTVVAAFRGKYPGLQFQQPCPDYDDIPHVFTAVSLKDHIRSINIVASRTDNNLLPIFNFHSSVVMNFVSAREIYCGYPDLTFKYRNIINVLMAAAPGCNCIKFAECIVKYEKRGYNYATDPMEWPGYHENSFAEPGTERSLRDGGHFSFAFAGDTKPEREGVWEETSWAMAKNQGLVLEL
ncbi:hypothetical protein DXG01_014480 [Tephrocybe rancida]|nr:hypothetical protein DXG01_014480 [Tephrocybe rancida]